MSFNRVVARILEGVRISGRNHERLLEVVTIRRSDGREFSLVEHSLAQAIKTGESEHAEEVAFQVPDVRKVTALLNATPIRTADGSIESFVVTLQGTAPLENLERLQAEFLATASHEMRAPLTAIKVSAATVLGDDLHLDPTEIM